MNREPLTGEVGIASQWDADRLVGRIIRDGTVILASNHVNVRDFWLFVSDSTDLGVQVPYGAEGIEIHHLYLDGSRLSVNNKGMGGGTRASIYAHHIESQGFADGLRYQEGSTYEYMWVHDLMKWHLVASEPYDPDIHPHMDGSQFVGASGAGGGFTIRRSFINAPPTAGVVSCVLLNATLGPIYDVLIEENYFSGGAFTIRNVDPGQGNGPAVATVRNNMFAPGWGENGGLWQLMNPATITRVGNRWMRSHRPVPLTNGEIARPANGEW